MAGLRAPLQLQLATGELPDWAKVRSPGPRRSPMPRPGVVGVPSRGERARRWPRRLQGHGRLTHERRRGQPPRQGLSESWRALRPHCQAVMIAFMAVRRCSVSTLSCGYGQ